jgi:hypothetical protein
VNPWSPIHSSPDAAIPLTSLAQQPGVHGGWMDDTDLSKTHRGVLRHGPCSRGSTRAPMSSPPWMCLSSLSLSTLPKPTAAPTSSLSAAAAAAAVAAGTRTETVLPSRTPFPSLPLFFICLGIISPPLAFFWRAPPLSPSFPARAALLRRTRMLAVFGMNAAPATMMAAEAE